MNSEIKMPLEQMLLCLDDLEYFVPSLDRIGSASLSSEERMLKLQRFLFEGDVFSRRSDLRLTR